ncbi:MAG: poly-gamma-glutamate synthase PgsB [Bacteroidetes bacterium]|nr:poly-gamma-glutamate synthase PgsB [Bacteroidota bacterium]
MLIIVVLLATLVSWLLAEAMLHSRRLRRIPIRITVSGTRGKSGTVRDIASVMRLSGLRVLAKTTGTEAAYILPDGTEEPVKRHGITSIDEQIRLVKKASSLGADALVTEIMSISPENHRAETQMILKPDLTVFTNFNPDHIDAGGNTVAATEEVMVCGIAGGATVIVHRNHLSPFIQETVNRAGATLVVAGTATSLQDEKISGHARFPENTDLVAAAASWLGIDAGITVAGLAAAHHDRGRAEIIEIERNGKRLWFATTFAANDPLSTEEISRHLLKASGIEYSGVAGLLSFRADRAERTKQWLDYLNRTAATRYQHLFVTGSHTAIAARRIKGITIISPRDPQTITETLFKILPDRTAVFGLANIAGAGLGLTEYWRAQGIKSTNRWDTNSSS